MSLEALARVSKLLASVPSTTTPDSWTTALAPQLLDLLDDPIVDNKRIASYIIGTGFLGKRRLGAPGTVGWKLFAGPVIEALDPPLERCPVPERTLKLALDRLSTMIHFYSNPGLTKRLVEPVFLPLWGLQGYALKNRRSAWGNLARQILDMYMKIYATDSRLLLLSDQLLWDGSNSWTFSPGASGGIEIRKRDQGESDVTNVMDIVTTIDGRVDQYSSLLRAAVVTDDQLGKVFTHVSRCWLLGASSTPNLHRPAIDTRDPIQSLVYAKLTQKLLEDYKDRIASSFEGIIQLVDPIFSAFVVQHQDGVKKRSGHSQPSLAGLSEIISEEGEAGDDDQESETTVSAALGLLSTLLTSSDGAVSSTDTDLLDRVANSIKYIAQTPFQDSSLNVTASNVLMLLNLHRETPEPFKVNKDANDNDPVAEDRNKHRKALKLLSDDLAPVRAQGLSALTDLVSKGSPVLDIASTAILLVSLLQDDDEYIYLSAIKTLGLLASRHPKTAVQFLLERYTDPHEDSTLDVRIKAGEALNKTIEHLGQLFVEGVAKMVGESMIAVVSRRGERPKTQRKRERAKRKADKDAEDASSDGEIGEEEADDEEGNINAHAARIVEGWADTGREEDIRIRTSALSILGTAIETNIAGVGATITSAAMDCALAVLKLEKNDERAILRRAAVMVIMSVIRAIDAAEERGQRLGFGFAGENLEEVVIVLRYVEVTDTDEVVVGHTRAVIESLEAWRQKSLLGSSSRSRGILDMGFDRDGPGFGGGTTNVRIEELP